MAYLSVNYGSGDLIEQSKTAKDGFEKHETKTGNVVYRKKYKEIKGTLVSAGIKKVQFPGKPEFNQFSFSLKDGEEYFNVQMDILNQYGAIDSYLENFITKAPNLKKGELYSFSSYAYTPEGGKYAKRGWSIKQGEVKIEKALTYSYNDVVGDIPALVITEEEDLEGNMKKVINAKKKTKFLYDTLKNWLAENFPQTDSPATKTEPKPKEKVKTREEEVDSQFNSGEVSNFVDDLPF